jgi:hypothetical protein
MHKELSSRSFTEALLRLAGDRVRCAIQLTSDAKLIDIEHTSTSQDQDTRADGGVDTNVLQRSRFRHHGAGVYEAEDAEYVLHKQMKCMG